MLEVFELNLGNSIDFTKTVYLASFVFYGDLFLLWLISLWMISYTVLSV